MSKPVPLSAAELIAIANGNIKVPPERVLATYADPGNWVQLYHCEAAARGYEPKACEWAFVGPVRPPYELAQWAIKEMA